MARGIETGGPGSGGPGSRRDRISDGLDRDEVWQPLERFAALIGGDQTLPLLLPCEFVHVGAHDEPFGRVQEYEHVVSHRVLLLTTALQVVEHVPALGGAEHCALGRGTQRGVLERLLLSAYGGCLAADEYCDRCCDLIDRADPDRDGHPLWQFHRVAPWRDRRA